MAQAGLELPSASADAAEVKQAVARLFAGGAVLCDGAMGSMLYGRGVFINRCYDELNVSQPELVRAVHTEYLQAGAQVIETNTFGANAVRLERYGLEGRVRELNVAGVRLARECVTQMREKQASEAFVAGAIGPLGVRLDARAGQEAKVSEDEAYAAFAQQVKALAEGGRGVGADLLVIETMSSMTEAKIAVSAAKHEAEELPLIVMVTVNEEGDCLDGTSPEEAARVITDWGADAVGCNCSAGPAIVLSVIERMRRVTELPLAAMPNAGTPKQVEGRNLYLSSPEYMSSFARKFARAGVTFIGGCCGTTPKDTRAMRGALRALEAQETGVEVVESGASVAKAADKTNAVEPPPLQERSKIGAMIAAGQFCTLVEIVPPKGFDCSRELEGAEELHRLGVDAINVPDSPRASARMSALSLCLQIQQRVGIETVLHYTCRDRNLLSIQSDLLGAASLGLRNILCLTGDPPKMGAYPDATAVFDVDAVGLTRIVHDLNRGLDLGGNSIGGSAGFTISVAANPGVSDIDNEVRRFAAKVEAGGEFGITQPVFDLRLLEQFLRRIEQFRIPMIAGIWPLTSVKNAEFMRDQLKVSMPQQILERMGVAATPAQAQAEGVAIAQEMLNEARSMVQGVQVSAPFGKYRAAAQVLGFARE